MSLSREFEIHFAAEAGSVSSYFMAKLSKAGFRDDALVEAGVRFPPICVPAVSSCPLIGAHVTWDTFDRREYLTKLAKFREIMSQPEASACIGYAHAEVTRSDEDVYFYRCEFDHAARFPVAPLYAVVKPRPKTWDIHVSARLATLHPDLEEVLRHGGLYSIDLRKGSRGVFRVFTTQGVWSPAEGRQLFASIVDYLQKAGGFEGTAKFEQTVFFETYGQTALVPPTIDRVQYVT